MIIVRKPAKPEKHRAGFHRTEWAEFKPLPIELQKVKESLMARNGAA